MIDVTDTAAAIARLRAAESELPAEQRLFDDPFARHFSGGAEADEALAQFLRVPFFADAIRVRTRYIDDAVRAAVSDGMRQLVLLGAGFDCRAFRLHEIARAGARVFEVDYAAQLARKRGILDAAGVPLPESVRAVASDFEAEGYDARLASDLGAAGFVAERPVLFVCEGVLGYLKDPEIDRCLRLMATAGARGSRAVFNYGTVNVAPERLAERVHIAGFTALEDHTLGALYVRYIGGTPPAGGEFQRIALART
jgi:methyltransferase (TIGR00027 family)